MTIKPDYKHTQVITYWKKGTIDRYNNPQWTGPFKEYVRREDGARLVLTNTGREVKGRSTIYARSEILDIGDQVYFGQSGELKPIVGSFEVLQFEKISNLRGTKTIYSWVL